MLTDELHVVQTQAFIDENPVEIVISRRTKSATASGGWKWGPASPLLSSQTMRKVGSSRLASTIKRTTEDGREVIPTATLIALPDADVEIGDLFDLDGDTFEVVTVENEHPPWRLSAEVVEYV